MEAGLNPIGFFLGNALLSGMGLVFAIGVSVTVEFKTGKKWWIVLWASLLGFYLLSAVISASLTQGLAVLMLKAVFNATSTSAAAMLYLHCRDKKRLKSRKSILIFSATFLLVMVSTLLSLTIYSPLRNLAGVIGQILSWIFFVLLAWNYREQHMPTTLLLLAYANLQLPAILVGKGGWGNDFVLLLAAKLSLIGAMYHMLGIRDAKPKPSNKHRHRSRRVVM